MKKIRLLIARIDRIGDVVLSTPIPREVKKKNPDNFVAVLVRKYTRDIYLNNPNVDEIILYDEDEDGHLRSFLELVKIIRKYRFNYAFMLLPDERLNWILFFSGIINRIGVGHKLYQFLSFSRFVDRKKYIPLRHEADYCLDMVRKLGIVPQSTFPEIHLSEVEKSKVLNLKNELAPNGEFVVGIHTTSGGSSPNLSPANYRIIAEKLSGNKNYVVLFTDINPTEEILNIKDVMYPGTGHSLREDILLFAALDVLISASTGPMHICAALKVPTVSLFCPLPACSPELWGPLGNKSEIILPEGNQCSPFCPYDPHKCDFSSEGIISPERIVKRVISFLSNE
jgi:heptosyltransferase-2